MVLDGRQGYVSWLFGDDIVHPDYWEHLDCWRASRQGKLNRGGAKTTRDVESNAGQFCALFEYRN
jgi:hypothetical protein